MTAPSERADAIESIRTLVAAYSYALDRGDFDALAVLFERGDFLLDGGRTPRRGAALGEWFRKRIRIHDDGSPRTTHVNPNVVVRLDAAGRTATARTPVLVLQMIDGDIRCIFTGSYDDTFVSDDDGWRFASRVAHARLVGDMSQHLAGGNHPQPR